MTVTIGRRELLAALGVTTGGRVTPVFMRLTRSIPMVLPSASDPVGVGWAQSLAHPGGNVTGFTGFELSMLGKSLEILKQIAPAVVRVALIYNPDNPNSVHYRRISEESSSDATARVHHAARRRGGVAASGARAAARAHATDCPARFEALEFGSVAPRLPRRRACRRCCAR
jgi:hypothetical protein